MVIYLMIKKTGLRRMSNWELGIIHFAKDVKKSDIVIAIRSVHLMRKIITINNKCRNLP